MKNKLNAWAIVTEMNVRPAIKCTKMMWIIVLVEKIVPVRTIKNSYSLRSKIGPLISFIKFNCLSWMSVRVIWLRFAQWNCRIVQRSSFEQELPILLWWTENFANSVSWKLWSLWMLRTMLCDIRCWTWTMSVCAEMPM